MAFYIISVVALATYFDLKSRLIPNWLTYSAILTSFIYPSAFHLIAISIGVISAVLFGKYVGAGDIKLAIAIAIWSHILNWSQYWLYLALMIGGIYGLLNRRKSLPFAPFMALGLVLANVARSQGFI